MLLVIAESGEDSRFEAPDRMNRRKQIVPDFFRLHDCKFRFHYCHDAVPVFEQRQFRMKVLRRRLARDTPKRGRYKLIRRSSGSLSIN